MISAERYASDLGSYWRTLLPMLDGFVRSVNGAAVTYARVPVLHVSPKRSSLVSELAFKMFREGINSERRLDLLFGDKELVGAQALEARKRIAQLDGKAIAEVPALDATEVVAAAELASSTQRYFLNKHEADHILVGVAVPGCGLVDAAEADVLAGRALYELKAVQRSFRGADFRQVLVYAALNYAGRTHEISDMGVLNPRLGAVYRLSIDSFARLTAGISGNELLAEVVEAMSRPGTSR